MAYNPINQVFDTVADLMAQKGTPTTTVYVSGQTTINDGNGGNYMWDDTSTATHDGFKIVQVPTIVTGRWLRSKNSNYNTGQIVFSGIGLQTTYSFNHGLNFTPVKIFLQARSLNAAAAACYISAINSTQFTVIFTSVPILGSNNLIFDWLAVKQQ